MGHTRAVVSLLSEAAEEAPQKSFLIPDGTFFVVLTIFLIVLGVISTFVVPPIMKVLRDRDDMVTKTLADSKKAAEQAAAAEADYEQHMSEARVAASAVRDEARAQGRAILEDMRGKADTEVASTLASASAQLQAEGDALAADLRAKAETLSATLAGRILGVDSATVGR